MLLRMLSLVCVANRFQKFVGTRFILRKFLDVVPLNVKLAFANIAPVLTC